MYVVLTRLRLSWEHFLLLFQDEFNRPLRDTEELQTWGLLLSPARSTGGQRSEDSLGDKLPPPSSSLSAVLHLHLTRCIQGFSCPLLSIGQLGLDTHVVSALHGKHSSPLSQFPQFYRRLLEQNNVREVPRKKSHPLLTRLNFMDCGMNWDATDPILAYLYKPL